MAFLRPPGIERLYSGVTNKTASAALFAASVSTSTEASLVITSFRIAAIDLRLANHWRRILVSNFVASRSEEHTSELQSLMRISYAVFCLKKKKTHKNNKHVSLHNTHVNKTTCY